MKFVMARRWTFVCCSAAILLLGAQAFGQGVRKSGFELRQDALKLMEEGRFDEAINIAGQWSSELQRMYVARLTGMEGKAEPKELLAAYRKYFRYYPFGGLAWQQDAKRWSGLSTRYLALRKTHDPTYRGPEREQDAAAAELFQDAIVQLGANNTKALAALADQIVDKYPMSMFVAPAVLSVGSLSSNYNLGDPAPKVYEDYLARMKAGRSSPRGIFLVRLASANYSAMFSSRADYQHNALEAYQELFDLTELTSEKRWCLIKAADTALAIGDKESLKLSRDLYRRYVKTYPDQLDTPRARAGVIRTFLSDGQLDAALAEIRQMEKTDDRLDTSPKLFMVSQAHFGKEEYDKSLELLKEIAERFPDRATHAKAQLGMGEVYGKLGDEEKMLAAYKRAAQLPRVQTQASIMDASDTHNRAIEFLADYYMKKSAWRASLDYWQIWKPSSWCGTCAASMRQSKRRNIMLCRLHLGDAARATRTALDAIFAVDGDPSPEIVQTLVTLYEQAGQLEDLRRMVSRVEPKLIEAMREKYFKDQPDVDLKEYVATHSLRDILSMYELAGQQKFDSLIAMCREDGWADWKDLDKGGAWSSWKNRAAAKALAASGQRSVAAIEKSLRDSEQPSSWLIYSLGCNESMEAYDLLVDLTQRDMGDQATNVIYSIWMKGKQGEALVKQIADNPQFSMSQAAAEWLDSHKQDLAKPVSWPRPEQRSLPTDHKMRTASVDP